MDSSFSSDIGKEMSLIHLAQQLTEMANKYSDLKISSSREISVLQDKNNKLKEDFNNELVTVEILKNKLEKQSQESREEINRLKVKTKVLEKARKDAEAKVVEIGELRQQLTKFTNDMIKYEHTEKKLREAIKKKKEELIKEKKLRRKNNKEETSDTKQIKGINNKLEKDIRNLKKNNTKLQDENGILKKRVFDLLSSAKDMNPAYYRTGQPTSLLNNSLAVPLNNQKNIYTPDQYESLISRRKGSTSSFHPQKSQRSTMDARAASYKVLPTLNELLMKEKRIKPISRKSCNSLSRSSFVFGDRKRSNSRDYVIGDLETGSCQYCETCKYRVWRKKLYTYDPIDLINNRDLIRDIKCLACEKTYDVKFFINHAKDCRLTKGVPPFIDDRGFKNITKTDLFSCGHLDNSVSSNSPKDLFEESRVSSNNREIIFCPDEELLLSSPPDNFGTNESEIGQKISSPNVMDLSKISNGVTKLLTPRGDNRLSERRMTDTKDSSHKKSLLRRKTDLGSDTEDTLFNTEEFRRPLNPSELINTIQAIDACDNLAIQSRSTMEQLRKASFCRTTKNSTKKSQNKFKLYSKKKSIPTLKFADSVLKQPTGYGLYFTIVLDAENHHLVMRLTLPPLVLALSRH